MYNESALLTDQYELVMAQGYWELGMAEQEAVFYLAYRSNPFEGDYVIAAGLAEIIHHLTQYRFSETDIEYLASLHTDENEVLFQPAFLTYLSQLKFTCDIDAVIEGTLVQPREPLVRIQGPIIQCQILETMLINFINFSSLIATKASRIRLVAGDDPVVEFGLRRAQGPNGGLMASRAAFIGGCDSTSNMLAGKTYGIPVRGTQAHSWIMAFPDEVTAFHAFANVMKKHTVLLVDTYDTLTGVKHAIEVGKVLRSKGNDLSAIRLDSGDITYLSQQARELLDNAGFHETRIFASGDMDEYQIQTMKDNHAEINAWGIGTKLVTSYDQPALNTIYKLAAIRNDDQTWNYKLKISDQPEKTTLAGIMQVRRYYTQQKFISDVIYDVELGINDAFVPGSDQYEDLLVPIFRQGKLVYQQPDISSIRDRTLAQMRHFMQSHHHKYPVTLEKQLRELQRSLGADI